MSQANIAGQIMNLLYENSRLLCVWLEKHLPAVDPRWWESMVLPALSYQQCQRAEAQGFTNLKQFDLAALLRILDKNWYPISQHLKLTSQDRHFVKEMQTIRNRWAHINAEGVNPDDAYRDLDTIQRLALMLGAEKKFLEEIKSLKTKAFSINSPAASNPEPKVTETVALKNENQNIETTPMAIKIGSIVCLVSSPDKQGAVIALEGSTPDARCTVFMDGKAQPYYLSQIKPVADNQKKSVVPLPELHSLLTCLQVNHPSMATLYSLNAARIDFVPYQFRPALKIIHADQPRILIADGVGVGKTIEAGLIMRELQARNEINSVLIICPKPLITERKWELEMKRFDERFTQLDGSSLRLCIEETHVEGDWPEQHKKTIIPFSLFDENNLHGEQDGRKKRRGLLDLNPPPRFDLVIVDEAHHIRNASTYAHDAVRFFCEHAEAVVFLTATPNNLGRVDFDSPQFQYAHHIEIVMGDKQLAYALIHFTSVIEGLSVSGWARELQQSLGALGTQTPEVKFIFKCMENVLLGKEAAPSQAPKSSGERASNDQPSEEGKSLSISQEELTAQLTAKKHGVDRNETDIEVLMQILARQLQMQGETRDKSTDIHHCG